VHFEILNRLVGIFDVHIHGGHVSHMLLDFVEVDFNQLAQIHELII
jgi:hypothetical protein